MQIFADVLQTPVEIIDVSESGTLGAAICGAVAAGIYKDFGEAVGRMVHVKRRVEPDTANKEVYEKKYRQYNKIIKLLDPYWNNG